MKTMHTFSVLFWINMSRLKNNKADIFARISQNGKRVNLSLKIKVEPDLWDTKKAKVKGTSHQARQVNQLLVMTRSQIYQAYVELKEKGGRITPQAIKARYLGDDKDDFSLKDIFAYHNEKNQSVLNKYTLRHYKTSQRYLLEYVQREYQLKDIPLKDLNYSFIVGFESFLRSYQPRHYQSSIEQNTIIKHIQRLRKMTTLAFHMEWIDRDPFVRYKPRMQKKERDFLTEVEMHSLEKLVFPTERLEVVRDLFIFSCYTGIPYGDIMLLTPSHLIKGEDGNQWIFTKRIKTSNSVKVPLLPKALDIISKYKDSTRTIASDRLLPKISNQKVNAYLKEIAELVQITKKLTFHMARHTFATTVTLSNGVPLETISKLLGHAELKTTQIYAQVVEQKVSKDMMILRQKMNRSIDTESQGEFVPEEISFCYHYKE